LLAFNSLQFNFRFGLLALFRWGPDF